MFNCSKLQSIDFVSNPPFEDSPVIVPDDRNGVIVNKIVYQPCSNRSPFDGIKFSPETMSLRSKLNLGVHLDKVSFGQLENDPNKLQSLALHLENRIYNQLNFLRESEPVVDSPSQE